MKLSRIVFAVLVSLCVTGFAQDLPAEFEQLDVNGDGVLSGTEAIAVREYDADDNGEVSAREYLAAKEKEAQAKTRPTGGDRDALEAKFRELDRNADGRLSGTEMKSFEALDTNRDARVTFEEFMAAAAQAEPAGTPERSVIVPDDATPFSVEVGDIVRLSANGIAGSTISMTGSGPMRVLRARDVYRLVEGQPTIGGSEKEFEVVATGRGEVQVLITVEYPTGSPPMQSRYRFTVR